MAIQQDVKVETLQEKINKIKDTEHDLCYK
jgi:hypothetical protein